MLRTVNGVRTAGVEATLLSLVDVLDGEALEIACEDARRRGHFGSGAQRGSEAIRSQRSARASAPFAYWSATSTRTIRRTRLSR